MRKLNWPGIQKKATLLGERGQMYLAEVKAATVGVDGIDHITDEELKKIRNMYPTPTHLVERCLRCGGEMVGGCRKKCKQCGWTMGCGE